MGYLARETATMSEDQLRTMLLDGASRVLDSEDWPESCSASYDQDYGHEIIDAVLDEIKARAWYADRCPGCGMGERGFAQRPSPGSWSGCPTCGWCY